MCFELFANKRLKKEVEQLKIELVNKTAELKVTNEILDKTYALTLDLKSQIIDRDDTIHGLDTTTKVLEARAKFLELELAKKKKRTKRK